MPFVDFKLNLPETRVVEDSTHQFPVEISAPDDCCFYAGRVVENVRVGPSPGWLQQEVERAGFRSINNVVDATNYVFWILGQPLHAFDLDLLAEKIVVRRATAGETITTLDGVKRALSDEVLVIADAEKSVAIAGIMGGADTEVTAGTRNLFIESAYFNPARVRRASKALGLLTEASQRFEKRADFGAIIPALDFVCSILKQLCNGRIGPVSKCGDFESKGKVINLDIGEVGSYLGCPVDGGFIVSILKHIGCRIARHGDSLKVEVPISRYDLDRKVDLIEEVAKYLGYDAIPEAMPRAVILPTPSDTRYERIEQMRDCLLNLGFSEVVNAGFLGDEEIAPFKDEAVEIINPLSRNLAYLRPSMLPDMLRNFRDNLAFKNERLAFFEIGSIFHPGFKEEFIASLGVMNRMDFYSFKGKIETFLEKFGIDQLSWNLDKGRIGMSCVARAQDVEIAKIAMPDSDTLKLYRLEDEKVLVAEIALDYILEKNVPVSVYRKPPKIAPIRRDIALIVPKTAAWNEISTAILDLQFPVERISVFDIYEGKHIPANCTGVAVSIFFANEQGTLTRQDVEVFIGEILKALKGRFNITLRQ
jgi:phenylalanyl-tRNA synthetase beta chain